MRVYNYKDITQCLICNTPLGSDSRDSGFIFCHEHMKCSKCGESITAAESQNCYDAFLESLEPDEGESEETVSKDHVNVIHARCLVLEKQPSTTIKQSELAFLNNLRLMVIPDMDASVISNENKAKIHSQQIISNMNLDQMRLHLCMLEACTAWVKNTIKQDPTYRKEDDKRLEKQRFTPTKYQENPKTHEAYIRGPQTNPAVNQGIAKDTLIMRFMEVHGIADKNLAKKIFNDRAKAAAPFIKLGMPETEVLDRLTKDLIASGRLPK